MACTNMLNSDHRALCGVPAAPQMSPRISFSSDFVMEPPAARTPGPPPNRNFEFAVGSHSMIDADQLFFKGRLVPLKGRHQSMPQRITTLRDELRDDDDDDGGAQRERPVRGSIKWKELLGLKKVVAKKRDKNEGGLRIDKPTQDL